MRKLNCALAVALAVCFGVGVARADVPAITMTGYTINDAEHTGHTHFSIGYTFTLTEPLTITALGTMDFGGTSIATAGSMPVAIYYSAITPNKGQTEENLHFSGTAVPGASALVTSSDPILAPNGSAYTSGDGFRYHFLDTPITLDAETYEILASNMGTGYARTWTGVATFEGIIGPRNATFSSVVPSNGAGYQTDLAPSTFLPGLAGPNFLVLPEPASLGVLVMAALCLVRRRGNVTQSAD